MDLVIYLYSEKFKRGAFHQNSNFMTIREEPLYLINIDELGKIDPSKVKKKYNAQQQESGDKFNFKFKKVYFDKEEKISLEKRLDIISLNAGTFYYCAPENHEELSMHLKRIGSNYNFMRKHGLVKDYSYLYMGTLNREDYRIYIVNEDRIIVYANYQLRKNFGMDLLGKKCHETFPVDDVEKKNDHNCIDCPVRKDLQSGDGYCRRHFNKWSDENNGVYLVTETVSPFKIRVGDQKIQIHPNRKMEELYINVARRNSEYIICQYYQELIHPLIKFDDVIEVIKFAFLGGKKAKLEEKVRLTDRQKKIIENLVYKDQGQERLLNLEFGRFRIYTKTIDNFSSPGVKKILYQIFTDRRIDSGGDFFDDQYQGELFIPNDKSQIMKEVEQGTSYIEITEENIKDFDEDEKKIFQKIGIFDKKHTEEAIEPLILFPLYMSIDNEEIRIKNNKRDITGIISVDWLGKNKKNKKINDETKRIIVDFIHFITQAIKNALDYESLDKTYKITRIIAEGEKEEGIFYEKLSEEICKEINPFIFEIFSYNEGLNDLKREYVYYNPRDEVKKEWDIIKFRKEIEKLNGRYKIDNCLVGKMLKTIINRDEKSDYYHIMNYSTITDQTKKWEKEFIGRKFKRTYEFNNALVLPVNYNKRTIGMIKVTNNLREGKVGFLLKDIDFFVNLSNQLSVSLQNKKMIKREDNAINVFLELSKIIETDDLDLNFLDNKIVEIKQELKKSIEADHIYYWKIINNKKNTSNVGFKNRFTKNSVDDKVFNEVMKSINIKSEDENNKNHLICKKILNQTNFPSDTERRLLYFTAGMKEKPFGIFLFVNDTRSFPWEYFKILTAVKELIEGIIKIVELKKKSLELMGNISHQIISPLRGLAVHCKNLVNSKLPEKNENHFKFKDKDKELSIINLIRSQTMHVRNITQNWRNFLNFEVGRELQYTPKKVNLTSLLIRIASIYQPIAKEQDIVRFEVDSGAAANYGNNPYSKEYYVKGNDFLLEQIFNCLADNAIKYSNKRSVIKMEIIEEERHCCVKTINQGIIIKKDEWKKIFAKDYRAPLAKKRFEQGSGLGLYIVKKICDQIKAECYVEESDKAKGTMITIKLKKENNK